MIEPNIFTDVLVRMMNGARSPAEQLRIGRAIDAAVAFGMWRAMGGETDGLTREQVAAVYFAKVRGLGL